LFVNVTMVCVEIPPLTTRTTAVLADRFSLTSLPAGMVDTLTRADPALASSFTVTFPAVTLIAAVHAPTGTV
jgi:hypothetical protein